MRTRRSPWLSCTALSPTGIPLTCWLQNQNFTQTLKVNVHICLALVLTWFFPIPVERLCNLNHEYDMLLFQHVIFSKLSIQTDCHRECIEVGEFPVNVRSMHKSFFSILKMQPAFHREPSVSRLLRQTYLGGWLQSNSKNKLWFLLCRCWYLNWQIVSSLVPSTIRSNTHQ